MVKDGRERVEKNLHFSATLSGPLIDVPLVLGHEFIGGQVLYVLIAGQTYMLIDVKII